MKTEIRILVADDEMKAQVLKALKGLGYVQSGKGIVYTPPGLEVINYDKAII